jgi:hypothetical protein
VFDAGVRYSIYFAITREDGGEVLAATPGVRVALCLSGCWVITIARGYFLPGP